MVDVPSTTDLVRTWVAQHLVVDYALQVAVVAVLAVLTLVAAVGVIYCWWWLCRLVTRENRARFIQSPIPELRRGRVVGQEFEVAGVARVEAEREANQTVAELTVRLNTIELTVQKLLGAFARFEDIISRA